MGLSPFPGIKAVKDLSPALTAVRGGRGMHIALPEEIKQALHGKRAKNLAGWVNLVTNDGFGIAEFYAGVMLCDEAPLKDRMAAAKELKEIIAGKSVQPVSMPGLEALLLRQSGLPPEDAADLDGEQLAIPDAVLNAQAREIPTAAVADDWGTDLDEEEPDDDEPEADAAAQARIADDWGDSDLLDDAEIGS